MTPEEKLAKLQRDLNELADGLEQLGYTVQKKTGGGFTGIDTGVTGHVRGGQTKYNTGTGYFLGYSGGAFKLSIGDGAAANSLTWDGVTLTVNGSPVTNANTFGDGSDGNVTISSDTSLTTDMYYNNLTINTTFTLNPNGFRIFVKGTLTMGGTG